MGFGSGWFFMIIFWVVVVLCLVFFIRMIAGSGKREEKETAMDILKKRYAKGEITKEEFDRIKEDLTGT
jgi:putative membrane protein